MGGTSPLAGAAYVATPALVGNSCANAKSYVLRTTPTAGRLAIRLITSAGDDGFNCVGRTRSVFLPALPPGDYELFSYFHGDETRIDNYATFNKVLRVAPTGPTLRVSSLALALGALPNLQETEPVQRYFLTAVPSEVTLLLSSPVNRGFENPNWRHADNGFLAWPATGDAPSTVKPVCRYFSPITSSHFYSTKPEECALLKARPNEWIDEGIAFRILVPEGGACGFGTQPVYRAFSATNRNHRYTAEADTYRAIQLDGWAGEGVAFCAPLQ